MSWIWVYEEENIVWLDSPHSEGGGRGDCGLNSLNSHRVKVQSRYIDNVENDIYHTVTDLEF